MPTIVILDRESSRQEHLLKLIQRIDPQFQIEAFFRPESALSWLSWNSADLLVCDSLFPHIGAAELIRLIRQLPDGSDLSVLMMAPWSDRDLRRQALDAGANDLLATPVDDLELRARCNNLLAQRQQQKIIRERAHWLEQRIADATSEIRLREHETLFRLARAGEFRDEDSGNHVIRMAKYSRIIAEQLGLSKADCEAIELAAPMHDIGKIGIPDRILRKPGSLAPAEFEIMKTHTIIGHEIIRDSPSKYLQMGAVIALSHHEKFDGTGYPHKLGNTDIPLPARIVSVADAFDALTSARPHKSVWSIERALDYLHQQRGKNFDPHCLDAFISQIDRISNIQFMLGDKADDVAVNL